MLNSRIKIQSPPASRDTLGQPTGDWLEVCTIWGEIRHPSGLEQARGDGAVSVVRASIKVRRRSDITATMRGVDLATGRAYDIQAVLPDEVGREFMFLVCESTT